MVSIYYICRTGTRLICFWGGNTIRRQEVIPRSWYYTVSAYRAHYESFANSQITKAICRYNTDLLGSITCLEVQESSVGFMFDFLLSR